MSSANGDPEFVSASMTDTNSAPEPAPNSRTTKSLGSPRDFVVREDRKSTRLNSSHMSISYAVFCLKKKKNRRAAARGRLPLPRALGVGRARAREIARGRDRPHVDLRLVRLGQHDGAPADAATPYAA